MKSRVLNVELNSDLIRSEIEMLLRRNKAVHDDEDTKNMKFSFEALNKDEVIKVSLVAYKQQEVRRKSYNG